MLPAHVASQGAAQAVLQNLLMLYSTLDMQVCSFKVCAAPVSCTRCACKWPETRHAQVHLHAQMRSKADELRQALLAGRVHGDDAYEQSTVC